MHKLGRLIAVPYVTCTIIRFKQTPHALHPTCSVHELHKKPLLLLLLLLKGKARKTPDILDLDTLASEGLWEGVP